MPDSGRHDHSCQIDMISESGATCTSSSSAKPTHGETDPVSDYPG